MRGPDFETSAPTAMPPSTNAEGANGGSVATTLNALFLLYGREIDANLHRTLTATEPRATHELRVALRRLDATLLAFRLVIRRRVRRRLKRSARRLHRKLSSLRDADALIEDLIRPNTAPDDEALAALKHWREQVREDTRTRLLARAEKLSGELQQLIERGDWRKTGAKAQARLAARPAALLVLPLEAAWARAKRRGRRLAKLNARERHKFRVDLKTLRYITDLTGPDPSAPSRKLLRKLQTRLGFLNDLAMLARFDPPLEGKFAREQVQNLRRRVLSIESKRAEEVSLRAIADWRALNEAERQRRKAGE
jgi:CHAD domain-containing protein